MMMYKLLLPILATMVAIQAHAQVCTPDIARFPNDGYYTCHPNDPGKLPDALLNSPYTCVITLNIPTDTTISGLGTFNIDSVTLDRIPEPVTGLFKGLTYSAEPSNFRFPGGTKNCIIISGTPTDKSELGFSTVTLRLKAYFNGLPAPREESFPFRLASTLGKETLADTEGKMRIWPVPATQTLNVAMPVQTHSDTHFQIFNITGKKVMDVHQLVATSGTELDISGLTTGLYILKATTPKGVSAARFTVGQH
jgi:hypothetical protein